ncbi:hypothetical protein DL237_01620 [Pseudooceanicola sediminis]|uniref:VTT domain-containing protein n=1 Tax=Pseudooceanicola sediminis TaxID=2211117 RepID=A0A399J5H0_9RHOB|nr:VTT domain-containing protein [Pseudooceanicola sediminis]KAA2316810.1 hypothetical protein E0K93_00300 [Puniceibacterium sp. HSS470]RII40733.1 hypothetical protein DL237_01620 [Pseudooceanicola sediminis]|tara:strand:+ start:209807 stop:210541 length:735 start_codon:yes stop_codon:yes gene_type:complete
MNEELMELLASYGAPLVFAATLASCLALPVPASLIMLGAGALAAAGDLPFAVLVAAAFAGAIIGDHIGLMLGRGLQGALRRRLKPGKRAAATMDDARGFLIRRGGLAVLLSRFPLSPLGPYVNFAAGAAQMPLLKFTPFILLGELIWVSLYLGLGYVAEAHLEAVLRIASDLTGLLTALTAAAGLGYWLWRTHRNRQRSSGDALPGHAPDVTDHNGARDGTQAGTSPQAGSLGRDKSFKERTDP